MILRSASPAGAYVLHRERPYEHKLRLQCNKVANNVLNQIDLAFAGKLSSVQGLMALSVAMLLAGAGLAYVSRIYPGQRVKLEHFAGIMIIAGLALLGTIFPSY